MIADVHLRRRLDGVRAASLGAVVHPRFRADLFTSYFQVQVSVAINSWINGVSVDEYVFPYWPFCPPRTGTQQVASTGKAPNSLRARWSSESRRSVHS